MTGEFWLIRGGFTERGKREEGRGMRDDVGWILRQAQKPEWRRDDKKEGGILSFSGNYLVGMIYLCIFAAGYSFW